MGQGRGAGKGKGTGKGSGQPGVVLDHRNTPQLAGNPNVRITISNPIKYKSVFETYLLAVVLGMFGAHHFYLGRTGFGVAYFFTLGLFGVGYVVDLFRVPCLVAEANRKIKNPETVEEKTACDAYILWFPFGILGFHHFYLRNYGLGILYLFTFGVFGIGWLIDAIRIPFMVDDINNRLRNKDPSILQKSVFNAYLFALSPLGILGGHHYYLGRYYWGLLYTLTLGLWGVGWVFDWCRIPCLVKRANQEQCPRLTDQPVVNNLQRKYLDDAYILLFPLGVLGLHHFYLRRHCWGVLYFCTFGIFGIGYLIDFCRLPCLVSDYNKSIDESQQIVSSVYSTHAASGAAVITVTTRTTGTPLSPDGAPVMQPPPQIWQPGYAYPPQYQQQFGAPGHNTGVGYPVGAGYPAAGVPFQPPSYMEVVGTGTGNMPQFQQGVMPPPQSPPGYGSTDTEATPTKTAL